MASNHPQMLKIDSMMEPPKDFSGVMEQIPLAELIQFVCLEGKDRSLLIKHHGKRGEIYFSGGQVVHAISPDKTGVEAFFSIMAWEAGTFSLTKSKSPGQTIEMPWNFLVMEALRRADEERNSQDGEEPARTPVKVLIVDDSPFFCKALRRILESMDNTRVIGQASNGQEALVLIQDEVPDLVTLDINMPVMAGDLTLKHIMIRSPAPVMLISGLSDSNLPVIMDFMRLGAVDFVPKPLDEDAWAFASQRIGRYVSLAREFRIKNIRRARTARPVDPKSSPGPPARQLLVVIGGAGGLLEIQKLLPRIFNKGDYACLVIQDMAPGLTAPVSEYLNSVCRGTVAQAKGSGLIAQGLCWMAHMDNFLDITGSSEERLIQEIPDMKGPLDLKNLLIAASGLFGAGLYVIMLSGAEVVHEGLEAVRANQGKVYVQNLETCLHPGPLEAVLESNLSDGFFEPEKIEDILPEIGSYEENLGAELLNGLSF